MAQAIELPKSQGWAKAAREKLKELGPECALANLRGESVTIERRQCEHHDHLVRVRAHGRIMALRIAAREDGVQKLRGRAVMNKPAPHEHPLGQPAVFALPSFGRP